MPDVVGIHHILPPIMLDVVLASSHFGQMPEPPSVVFANIAITPLGRCHRTDLSFELGEVIEPVITLAQDRAGIIPIVIALAVGREVDVPHGSPPGCGLVIADEAPPQVFLAR